MTQAPIRTLQLAGFMLLGLSAASALAEDITFVSQGGAYQEAQSKAILEPAAKKLGLTLKQDSSPKAYPIIKTQVESGKVSWDVVDLPTGDCIRGEQEGLFEKLDLALIPNAVQLPAELKDDYSVGYISYSTVMAYRTDAFKGDKVPKTWADFWDTETFPGQRSLRNLPRPTLEIALMADGVPPDQLYPLDVERAFKKLEQIKPHIATWWTSGGQSAQLISDGEVDLIQAWNGRISAVQGRRCAGGFRLQPGGAGNQFAVRAQGLGAQGRSDEVRQRGDRRQAAGRPAADHRLRPTQPRSIQGWHDPRRTWGQAAVFPREHQPSGAAVVQVVGLRRGRESRRTLAGLRAEEITRLPPRPALGHKAARRAQDMPPALANSQ